MSDSLLYLPTDDRVVVVHGSEPPHDRWRPRHLFGVAERWRETRGRIHHRRRSEAVPTLGLRLQELNDAAESILALPPNFDGESARPYGPATIARAMALLQRLNTKAIALRGRGIPTPDFLPGPHGGVDLHWTEESFELLMHVPEDPAGPASFYGDNYREVKLKGTVDPANPDSYILSLLLLQ